MVWLLFPLDFSPLSSHRQLGNYHSLKENKTQHVCYSEPCLERILAGHDSGVPEASMTHQAALVALDPELSSSV